MTEILIRKQPNWKDAWDTEKVKSLSIREKAKYDRRSTKGDFIVVKPGGWKWGKDESPPAFVLLKVPDALVKDVEYLLRPKTRPLTTDEKTQEITEYVNDKTADSIARGAFLDLERVTARATAAAEGGTFKLKKHRYALDFNRMDAEDVQRFEDGKVLIWNLTKLQNMVLAK